MRRILVHESLSGGDPVAGEADCAELLPQGRAMRNALLADLLHLADVQISTSVCERPGAHALPHAAPGRLTTVARQAGESASAFVARQSRLHDQTWVIAPETGGLLRQLQAAVGARGWIGCTAEAIALASSKQATLAALAQRGVATPLAFGASAQRWVVKPDDGAGSMATHVHAEPALAQADLARRLANGEPATLEPWVEGEALSLALLTGPAFAQVLAVNRQRIEVDGSGALAFRGVDVAAIDLRRDARVAALRSTAQAVAGALPGLRGFVGIDLVWHPQRGPVVIEVNPRLTCAYVGLSALLNRNLAAEVLAAHPVREVQHA